jgi:hypothetical protein
MNVVDTQELRDLVPYLNTLLVVQVDGDAEDLQATIVITMGKSAPFFFGRLNSCSL